MSRGWAREERGAGDFAAGLQSTGARGRTCRVFLSFERSKREREQKREGKEEGRRGETAASSSRRGRKLAVRVECAALVARPEADAPGTRGGKNGRRARRGPGPRDRPSRRNSAVREAQRWHGRRMVRASTVVTDCIPQREHQPARAHKRREKRAARRETCQKRKVKLSCAVLRPRRRPLSQLRQLRRPRAAHKQRFHVDAAGSAFTVTAARATESEDALPRAVTLEDVMRWGSSSCRR